VPGPASEPVGAAYRVQNRGASLSSAVAARAALTPVVPVCATLSSALPAFRRAAVYTRPPRATRGRKRRAASRCLLPAMGHAIAGRSFRSAIRWSSDASRSRASARAQNRGAVTTRRARASSTRVSRFKKRALMVTSPTRSALGNPSSLLATDEAGPIHRHPSRRKCWLPSATIIAAQFHPKARPQRSKTGKPLRTLSGLAPYAVSLARLGPRLHDSAGRAALNLSPSTTKAGAPLAWRGRRSRHAHDMPPATAAHDPGGEASRRQPRATTMRWALLENLLPLLPKAVTHARRRRHLRAERTET
jgi:hypothetical protein